jgi:hypothetical protein
MRLMTGQTQPSIAARCANDVVFGAAGVFIFGCGLTSRAQARGADDVVRDSGTGDAIPRCLQRFVRPQVFRKNIHNHSICSLTNNPNKNQEKG